MSSLLAAGLMIGVGTAMLSWYYGEALKRPHREHARAPGAPLSGAEYRMSLPPLGPVSPPRIAQPGPVLSAAPAVASAPTSPAAGAAAAAIPALSTQRANASAQAALAAVAADPLLDQPPLTPAGSEMLPGTGPRSQRSPGQTALERRLSGGVFAGAGLPATPTGQPTDGGLGPVGGLQMAATPGRAPIATARADALESLLRPSVSRATQAQVLPTQRLLLPKGTFIDCTLETAIDSTLPGMTACMTATDTFSADGTVVLLERGTKLIGETRGEVHQGAARVFVVWTEARTPSGVIVRLDSPATDALGRSGLTGKVNRHFWQRFGAAALVSTIDGVVQSEVESSSHGGTVVLDPTASEDVLTEILRSTVDMPPTVLVRSGARVQVLVARDVDFRSVYELKPR